MVNNPNAGLPCALYCRVDSANELSLLKLQEGYLRKFADNNELVVYGVYRDYGNGLAFEDRPALQQLFSDTAHFTYCITVHPFILAQDFDLLADLIQRLNENYVHFTWSNDMTDDLLAVMR
jgi:DNA invertase Pin-like site-specific DNA recombinase